MSDISSTSAEIQSVPTAKVSLMSIASEASSLIAEIAGPSLMGSKVKQGIDRVADATGLNRRRVKGLWNNEAKAILAEEMDTLRRVAAREKYEREAAKAASDRHEREEANARDEIAELRSRMDRFEQILAAQGSNEGGPLGP